MWWEGPALLKTKDYLWLKAMMDDSKVGTKGTVDYDLNVDESLHILVSLEICLVSKVELFVNKNWLKVKVRL